MPDLIAAFAIAALFALSLLYVRGCDRLKGKKS